MPPFNPELKAVGPGVWAWIQSAGRWGDSNAGLVAGERASLLVDTQWDQVLARRMLDAMGPEIESRRLELVVNTHSDGDHWWGNAVVPADAEIVTSGRAGAVMSEVDPADLIRFRRLASALSHLPGSVGALGRYTHAMFSPFRFEEVELRHPDRTFEREQVLEVGGRQVRLIEVGPAHTPGDVIVHVPDAKVVFCGDILFANETPIMWAGPVENWVGAIETLLGLDAEVYVPGHGRLATRAELVALRDYWSWLLEAVIECRGSGLSAGEAAHEIARSADFRSSSWRRWPAPEKLVISTATIYRNLDGEQPDPSPLSRLKLFHRVAQVADELARTG